MRRISGMLLAALFLTLFACTNRQPGPHATVYLRDGTSYPGTITSSSAGEIAMLGDDKAPHTFAMKDVKSVEYDQAAAPAQPPPDQTAAQQPAAQQPAGAPPAAPQPPEQVTDSPDHYHPNASTITTKTYDLAAGTEISVRSEETIDSSRAAEGQTYAAEVTRNVRDAAGAVVIPAGANAQIVIRSVSRGGRIRGASDLVVDLGAVSVNGTRYRLVTSDVVRRGAPGMGRNKRTAEYTGGGAAIGAIIGAIAGHGSGAAIGAGSGAGAGALAQIFTRGSSIKIPVETVLRFRLDRPLHVTEAQ